MQQWRGDPAAAGYKSARRGHGYSQAQSFHSWREQASEVGVIIIGVLIALSAEQTVEGMHWRSEVAESREALDVELGKNLGARKMRADQYGCIARRVDDLKLWLDSYGG